MTTSKPLLIWIDEAWMTHPKIAAWIEAGHLVYSIEAIATNFGEGLQYTPDLILSKHAWQWHDDLWIHADLALKQARSVKYGTKEKSTAPKKTQRAPKKTSDGN